MFGRYGKSLTEASAHYLDWSRTAELLLSASHRYSADEIINRCFIIVCTVVPAYVTHLRNEKKESASIALSVLAGFTGFSISHLIVLVPLIKKRHAMKLACNEIIKKIEALPNFQKNCSKINAVINFVNHLSLSDDSHGRASETLGTRKNILLKIFTELNQPFFNKGFWHQEVNEIISFFKDSHVVIDKFKFN